MNICPKCDYKVISNALFEKHLKIHEEGAIEVKEEVSRDPIQPLSDEIILRFTKSVWVQINGKVYEGTEITVKNMSIAAEIVRITRESYGPSILV